MRFRSPLYAAEIGVVVCLLAIAVVAAWWGVKPEKPGPPITLPAIGGSFTLTAADGREVTDQSFRGKIMLVYFGYTACPDACPTALNELAGALADLGPLADRVQPLFITVDPARDTRDVLAEYVRAFDPRILGLTGTPEQIAAAARAYGVSYAPVKTADTPDGYLVDHTSEVFVMDEEGRFVATFTPETPAAKMAERLGRLIARTS